MNRVAGLLVAVAVALTGCSTGEGTQRVPVIPDTPQPAAPLVTPQAPDPVSVTIPALSAYSRLEPLGLNPDGSMQVPSVHTPKQAGWFCNADPAGKCRAVNPGRVGRAIVVAHVDGDHQQGLFFHLRDLKPGDVVKIGRVDDSVLTFRVTKVITMPKSSFDTKAVYGDVDHPAVALITCGGTFDSAARSYRSNVVAFADLAA